MIRSLTAQAKCARVRAAGERPTTRSNDLGSARRSAGVTADHVAPAAGAPVRKCEWSRLGGDQAFPRRTCLLRIDEKAHRERDRALSLQSHHCPSCHALSAAHASRPQGTYMYCLLRDVTEEKKVEETLRCFLLTTRHANVACSISSSYPYCSYQSRPEDAVPRHEMRELAAC